ncbi:hypothetical protein L5B71_06830 [Avibacterium sp. 21-586]|uniref:hypothetical protein n=1 Tax=Avibacterium sp. 21-586 TaxID=2911534 RepID=UPI002247C97D|nr:hypothetical protein [Avibacterium sp. 21-586]MCW9710572.1 hypothetical protein [Avibacterium sp. 21-586]
MVNLLKQWRKAMIAILAFITITYSAVLYALSFGCYNPTGCQRDIFYPSYTTIQPMKVKGIDLPVGTIIQYDEERDTPKELAKPMKEKYIQSLIFPENSDVRWAGVKIASIERFFNRDMRGFSVNYKANSLDKTKNAFEKLWKHCRDNLGILVYDLKDWSFNRSNIQDISSCSVIYQRGVDARSEDFLDIMKKAMLEYDCKDCKPINIKFIKEE